MKKKLTPIKMVGFLAMLAGFVIDRVSDWVEEKELEELVDEKVSERLAD